MTPTTRRLNRNAAAALVAFAGLAAAAGAQPVNTRMEYQVSTDGTNWSNSINVLPGVTVQVRTLISYVGPGTAAGLGQLIFQPVVSSWHTSDTLLNSQDQPRLEPSIPRTGDFPPYGLAYYPEPGAWGRIRELKSFALLTTSTYLRGHLGTGTAAGLLRIAQANITNWIGEGATSGGGSGNNWNGGGGVQLAQVANPGRLTTDPPFFAETQNINAFGFAFQLDTTPSPRMLDVTTPAGGVGRATQSGPNYGEQNARWFASTTEVSSSLSGGVEVIDAHINVIPTPAGAAVLGLLAFAASRRRTRTVAG